MKVYKVFKKYPFEINIDIKNNIFGQNVNKEWRRIFNWDLMENF